jgi:hypothetical protein
MEEALWRVAAFADAGSVQCHACTHRLIAWRIRGECAEGRLAMMHIDRQDLALKPSLPSSST